MNPWLMMNPNGSDNESLVPRQLLVMNPWHIFSGRFLAFCVTKRHEIWSPSLPMPRINQWKSAHSQAGPHCTISAVVYLRLVDAAIFDDPFAGFQRIKVATRALAS